MYCDRTLLQSQLLIGSLAIHQANSLVEELYEPYHFYLKSFSKNPRSMFAKRQATRPLSRSRAGWWEAAHGCRVAKWLPTCEKTFDAVVHVVQSSSGTGVHIGTSAHSRRHRDAFSCLY